MPEPRLVDGDVLIVERKSGRSGWQGAGQLGVSLVHWEGIYLRRHDGERTRVVYFFLKPF